MKRRGLFGLGAGAVAVAALPAAAKSSPVALHRESFDTVASGPSYIPTQWDREITGDPDDWAAVINSVVPMDTPGLRWIEDDEPVPSYTRHPAGMIS